MRWISSCFLFLPLFALPLCAQDDALVGTWETSVTDSSERLDGTIRVSFGADSRFQLDVRVSAPDDFLAEAGDAVSPTIEEFTVQGIGTYRVDGDSLFAELTEVSMYVDGLDFFEVMTEIARAFARFSADLLEGSDQEVSDEDYPAFEQAAIEEFFAEFNLEEEFLGDFNGDLGTYSIDGDTLSITTLVDGEADTIELRRIDPSSAVARSTWGSLKADMRP